MKQGFASLTLCAIISLSLANIDKDIAKTKIS